VTASAPRAAYAFRTRWWVAAEPARCWQELERVATGRAASWWRGLRVAVPAPALEPPARVGLVVRAPLGYLLRVDLVVTHAAPGREAAARSTGDLDGRGRVALRPCRGGTELVFVWDVEVRRAWMRAASPLLRPLFRAAHAVVMRAGERGLRRALAHRRSEGRKPVNPRPGAEGSGADR